MSCFDKMTATKPSYSLDDLNNKIHYLLNDDQAQNKHLPPELLAQCAPEKINKYALAIGEFGRTPANPIPVNGPLGEITYLSRLILANTKEKIYFHRLCSSEEKINVYEITSQSGNFHDLLFLDMYHLRKSSLAPKGYKLQKQITSIRGINELCQNFPENLYSDLLQVTEKLIGFPVIDSDVKKINLSNFQKTKQQLQNQLH